MKHFALAGNPNCGKTTLFNSLTGSTAHVGNWPGVTVDKRQGTYKKLKEPVDIVDLPGIYSLSPYTSEEVISRNFILDEKPDCIINIIDATNLERNLYLTTQLLEIDVPMVVALNMMDEVDKSGDKIDVETLQKKLGVPVVEISALKERNLDKLMVEAYKASFKKREGTTIIENRDLKHLIGDVKIAFEGKKVENPLFHAVKLVELDELETKQHEDLVPMVEQFKNTFSDDTFGDDFEALIADARYKYISKNFAPVLTRKEAGSTKVTKSDKIDKVLTNKWAGIPIFLLILFVVFHLTFSEDLFYLNALGAFGKDGIVSFAGTAFEGLFANGGINSPGVILANFLNTITGMINDLFRDWLSGATPWVQAFICDGVLEGLFAVLGFLPQILCLFLFFSILEDSGYMARVAFILDRIFRKFGLSGRAFMPMIMGFGCSVPAMINTRTLADDKEKVATIRVIPFFSCGAKLPILTAIAGGIVSYFGVSNVDLITFSMYVLGMVTAIVAVIVMRNTTMRGEVPPFIMELPAYHLPQFRALMIHLWDKTKHFVKKAFTIILASTILIWALSHFTWSWEFLPEDTEMSQSILASIGQLIQPLFTPLGFGSQLTKGVGWVFAVAAITGLIAKENVIATFGTLAVAIVAGFVAPEEGTEAIEGLAAVEAMIKATGITVPGLLSFIAFNMTTIPCFAACATAKAELPEGKFKSTIAFWLITSFIVSMAIYMIGTWWWTCFIFIAVVAVAIVLIRLYNNKNGAQVELAK